METGGRRAMRGWGGWLEAIVDTLTFPGEVGVPGLVPG